MTNRLTIKNASVALPGYGADLPIADVQVTNGKISAIASAEAGLPSEGEVIDASGLTLLPGAIDDAAMTEAERLGGRATEVSTWHSSQHVAHAGVST